MPASSSPSARPPEHQGNPFIGAALVMFLLTAGLLFWKFGRSEPPPASQPAPTLTASEPSPAFEAPPPPPPPPPPAVVDAAPPEQPKKAAKAPGSGSSESGGCSGSCAGSLTEALGSALRSRAGQARSCYERSLRTNAMLQGRLMVRLRVASTGQVCNASVVQDNLGDPGVASCVVQKLRSGTLPPPAGGCLDTQVPMNFIPQAK